MYKLILLSEWRADGVGVMDTKQDTTLSSLPVSTVRTPIRIFSSQLHGEKNPKNNDLSAKTWNTNQEAFAPKPKLTLSKALQQHTTGNWALNISMVCKNIQFQHFFCWAAEVSRGWRWAESKEDRWRATEDQVVMITAVPAPFLQHLGDFLYNRWAADAGAFV